MRTSITVPRALILSANGRVHWRTRHRNTKQLRLLGLAHGRRDLTPTTQRVKIDVDVWKPRAGRYDPANLYPTVKALVDGITDAGIWEDDDHAHVDGPHLHHGGVDRELTGLIRFDLTVETAGV